LPGSDPAAAGEAISIAAYADGMSIVPALAPGGEGIGGISALLESAHVFSGREHRRPIRFTLLGAHGLALQGARELVEEKIATGAAPDLLTVTFDLSSGSGGLVAMGRGDFYHYRDESQVTLSPVARSLAEHAQDLAPLLGASDRTSVLLDGVNNLDGRNWQNDIPALFALDCEPLVNAGMNALTFATADDRRNLVDTPFDTVDSVQVGNVVRQIGIACCMEDHLLNDTTDTSSVSDDKIVLSPSRPSRMRLIGGFCTVSGRIVEYDPVKSFVPNTPVPGSLAVVRANWPTLMGVRADQIQFTSGANAEYRFLGEAPVTSQPVGTTTPTRISAFHLDAQTGDIDEAPSEGFFGSDTYPLRFPLTVSERSSPIVTFPCESVGLYGLVDPQDLSVLTRIDVLDAFSGAEPENYGVFGPPLYPGQNVPIEDAQELFIRKGERFMLLGGTAVESTRLVLTHSRLGDEAGSGYVVPERAGDNSPPVQLSDIAILTARDLIGINDSRLRQFQKYRIIGAGISSLEEQAKDELKAAESAERQRDWPEQERHARAAWGLALRVHPIVQGTANDVVNGVVFYLFLLLPFSYFAERLLFGSQSMAKQLMASIGIFVTSFAILRLIHPAFEIVTNTFMIFVAFVMGVLSLVVISFVLGKFEDSMRGVRAEHSGIHSVDIRRTSVAMAAFNLGVSNLRRRKARTALTTLTLAIMTFIILSFTSIVQDISLKEDPSNHPASYTGIFLRNPGLDPMETTTYRQLLNEFGSQGTVVGRAYYYGADQSATNLITLRSGASTAEVRAIEGLDANETKVLDPRPALVAGRWFQPGEKEFVELPKPVADELGIASSSVGKARILLSGTEFTVAGIFDPESMRRLQDLDGDGLMPADFTLSSDVEQRTRSLTGALRPFVRLDPSVVLIVPTETALSLGANIRNVAVAFKTPQETRQALNALMPRTRINLCAAVANQSGTGLEVEQFSAVGGARGGGGAMILVQLIIASVFVLNTMIASVYERTREIAVFSAVGLAPQHIAMLFFAESTVYGILGVVIGYFMAQLSAKVIVATGALQGLMLNFSSTSAVASAAVVMAVVLLSTIYPAKKASQIAAPAMNDEVFRTDPIGDEWELPMPFSVSAVEVGPLSRFLYEWLKGYEEFTIGDLVTQETFLKQILEQGSFVLTTTAWLAPFDLGVSQRLALEMRPSAVEGVYQLELRLTRLSGDPTNWPIVNRRFLDSLRKQFLTWRTLTSDQRSRYAIS
jgi:ABC-type lipoprotein release transport system permease subunit